MGANDVPFFWFLDPNFLMFCIVVGVVIGALKLLGWWD